MIQFTISNRGKLPTEAPYPIYDAEKKEYKDPVTGEVVNPLETQARQFVPRLRGSGKTVNAASFFRDCPWPTMATKGNMDLCLGELHRLFLHELCKGSSIHLPGIGTFTLTLRGDIVLREGREVPVKEDADEKQDSEGQTSSDEQPKTRRLYYHGKDVRVDGLRFTPDRELLQEVRDFEVDQTPYGMAYSTSQVNIRKILEELFAKQSTITRRDLELAADLVLSKHRLSNLLKQLVADGKLIQEGRGNQTRYRKNW